MQRFPFGFSFLKYEYEALDLSRVTYGSSQRGEAKIFYLAQVQLILSTTQISREARLGHIYLRAQ